MKIKNLYTKNLYTLIIAVFFAALVPFSASAEEKFWTAHGRFRVLSR